MGNTLHALTVILPVSYVIIDETIVLRTTAGSNLAAAAREAIVAFEVDDWERSDRSGWSVLAVGR